jgi:hypothetical protein
MKFIALVGVLLLLFAGFYYLGNLPESDNNLEVFNSEDTEMETRIVIREAYSFTTFSNWIESEINVEGCLWDSVSSPSDGHRMAGEIVIYPKSCFNLNNAVGLSEYTEIDGYYIIAYYDTGSGITDEEINVTKQAYKKLVSTFSTKQ